MATSPPYNPIIGNGGFETGLLAPWVSSDVTAATIGTGTQAFAGDHYLNLQTAPGNRANSVYQVLRELNTTATYSLNARVWGPAVSTANYCSAYIHVGTNATTGFIASVDISYDQSGQWLPLGGEFQPQHERLPLYVQAGCTLSGASQTGILLFDEITLTELPPVLE
ncbi:hypothetical protein BDW59DRAFT_161106 [Aspergillus cavernicola]|uniref:CBM-cenC domain-containing protein n=1 Tax=Aspergillus cavernicola TaxID=176166 RepID=A0ABR4IER7_9EURO